MGGAQQLAGIRPDLTCLGKIIGGGLPVGAYGGRADIMDLVAPAGLSTRRDSLGQPTGDDSGRVVVEGTFAEARRPGTNTGDVGGRARGCREGRRRSPASERLRIDADAVFHESGRRRLPVGADADTGPTAASSTRCSNEASIRPRRSSRPGSCRRRTASAMSSGQSRPPARHASGVWS